METSQSWPHLIEPILAKNTVIKKVINASISGDTTANGLERLPALLQDYQPNWLLIELGANDGLRGFPINIIENNLASLVRLAQENNVKPLLMQIQIPPNYGSRYTQAFFDIYPRISQEFSVPLLPFFMEKVVTTKGWLMEDGLHPTPLAQPWIAEFVANEISQHLP